MGSCNVHLQWVPSFSQLGSVTDNLTAMNKIPMLIVTLIFVGFLVYRHVPCLNAVLHLHCAQCNSVEILEHNSLASAAFLQDLCLHYFLLTYHNPVILFAHNLHCRTCVLFCKTGKPTASDEICITKPLPEEGVHHAPVLCTV